MSAITGCDAPFNVDASKTEKLPPGTGTIQVTMQGDFSKLRTTQAKVTDIDHVRFDVETTDATQSHTLSREQLANAGSSASANFGNLTAGDATASVTVFDAASKSIGFANQGATIQPGKTTSVNLTVQLVPTYTLAPGSLAANVSILDGPTVSYVNSVVLSMTATGLTPIEPTTLSSNGTILLSNNDNVSHTVTFRNDADPDNQRFMTTVSAAFPDGSPRTAENSVSFLMSFFKLQPGNYTITDDAGKTHKLTLVQVD